MLPDFLTTPADQIRSYECRAEASGDKREISGIGVPLGEQIEVYPGFREEFDQECEFVGLERAKLRYQHSEPIGVIAEARREPGELQIRGRVSKTARGDEALTLTRDGALDSFSIGFRPVEWTENEDGSVRYTKVRVREFSLVDQPAYPTAAVTDVRSAQTAPERSTPKMDTETQTPAAPAAPSAEVDELRGAVDDLTRAFTAFTTRDDSAPVTETRSAAEILRALVAGDEDTIRYVNDIQERAYTGGTTADSPIKDAWVGDLTRIFDASSGVLSEFFATGTLPDTGMKVEFAELKSNTTKFEEQENEGDDLKYGKVTLQTRTADVHTYGGYVQLTRQQIQRSSLPILNRSLEALARAAGATKKAVMRAEYLALVAARKAIAADAGVLSIGKTLAAATAVDWTNLVVDAAVRFDSIDLRLDGMIATPDVFKALNALEINGNKVMRVSPTNNTIGTLDLTALTGEITGVRVVCDTGRTGQAAEFAHKNAVRQYDSGLVQLQDENIINLSKDFSAYRYGAVADEIPAGVVPVKFAS